MANSFKKVVEIEINVTGTLGKVFESFSNSLDSSNLNLGSVRQVLQGVEESVQLSAKWAGELGKALATVEVPKGFTETLRQLRGLSTVKVPNLDGFVKGLSELQTVSAPDAKRLQLIIDSLKQLGQIDNIKSLPDLQKFANGLKTFKDVDDDAITTAASALEKLHASIEPYDKLSVPNLAGFAEGIQILADTTMNAKVTKLPMKFETLATSIAKLDKLKVPNLKPFAEGVALLADTVMNAKVTKLPMKFETLANSIKQLYITTSDGRMESLKVPQLGQFASGIEKIAKIDGDKIYDVASHLTFLRDALVEYKDIKVPQLSQFAKGIKEISSIKVGRIENVSDKLDELYLSIKKYDGTKTPQLATFAKGITALAGVGDIDPVVQSLVKLEPVINAFDTVKVPDLKGFAKGISILSGVKIEKGFATTIETIGEALKKFPKVSVFPDLKGFSEGISALNKANIGSKSKLPEKLKTIGDALKDFPKDISTPNLKNFAEGLIKLNKIKLADDFSQNLTDIASGILKLKDAKAPNLKNFADGLNELNTVDLREDWIKMLRPLAMGIKQFTRIKVPNLKQFAEGLSVLNDIDLKTITVENIAKLGDAFTHFKDIKVPNLKNFADGFKDLKQIGTIDEKFSKKLIAIAEALDVFSKVKVPSLGGIAKGIKDITALNITDKFSTNLTKLSTALSSFTKDIKIPALKPFAEGIEKLSTVESFNENLPEFFGRLSKELMTFDKVKSIPNLDSMAKGLVKIKDLDINVIAQKMRELSAAIGELDRAGKLRAFATFASDLNKVSSATSSANVKLIKTRSVISKFGYAAASASAGMSKFNGQMYGISRGLSAINAGLSTMTGFTASFAAVFAVKGAIRELSTFDDALRAAGATAQASSAQLKEFEVVIRDLGATTRYTSSQVAEAARQLSMAGFSVEETIGALPNVLQLATAGMMDIGRAADITTNILRGYKMEVDDLGRINDVLVTGFTSSSTNLEQLGTAFQYVGPLASAANIEFEETGALLAGLAQAGYHSSKAGMTLRNAITRLLEPTKRVSESLETLGISVTDSSGDMLSMIDILNQFKVAGADVSDIITIFGKRAGPGMAALINQGEDALNTFLVSMQNSEGVSARVARDMEAGMGGALRQIKSAWQEMAIEFGREIEPTVLEFIRGLTKSIRENKVQLADWASDMLGIAAIFGEIAIAVGKLVVENKVLMQVLLSTAVAFTALFKIMTLFGAISGAGGFVKFLTTYFTGLITVLRTAAVGFAALTGSAATAATATTAAGAAAGTATIGFAGIATMFTGIGAVIAVAVAGFFAYKAIVGKTAEDHLELAKKTSVVVDALNSEIKSLEELEKVFTEGEKGSAAWIEAEIELGKVVPATTLSLNKQGEVMAEVTEETTANLDELRKYIAVQKELSQGKAELGVKSFADALRESKKEVDSASYWVTKLKEDIDRFEEIEATGTTMQKFFSSSGANLNKLRTELQGYKDALGESLKMQATSKAGLLAYAKASHAAGDSIEEFTKGIQTLDLGESEINFLSAAFDKIVDSAASAESKIKEATEGIIGTWKKEFNKENLDFDSPFDSFYNEKEIKTLEATGLASLEKFRDVYKLVNGEVLEGIDKRKQELIDEYDEATNVYDQRVKAIKELAKLDESAGGLSDSDVMKEKTQAYEVYMSEVFRINKEAATVEEDEINKITDLTERAVAHRSVAIAKGIMKAVTAYEKEAAALKKEHKDKDELIKQTFLLQLKYNKKLQQLGAGSSGDAAKAIKEDEARIAKLKSVYEAYYVELQRQRENDEITDAEYKERKINGEHDFTDRSYLIRKATYDRFVLMYGADSTAAELAHTQMLSAEGKYLEALKTQREGYEKSDADELKGKVEAVNTAYTAATKVIKTKLAERTADLKQATARDANLEDEHNRLIVEAKMKAQAAMYLAAQIHADDMAGIKGVDLKDVIDAEQQKTDAKTAATNAQTEVITQHNKQVEDDQQEHIENIVDTYDILVDDIADALARRNAEIEAAVQNETKTEEEGYAEKKKALNKSFDERINIASARVLQLKQAGTDPEAIKEAEEELQDIVLEYATSTTQQLSTEYKKRIADLETHYNDQKGVIDNAYADRLQGIALFEAQDKNNFVQAQKDKLSALKQHHASMLALDQKHLADLKENPTLNDTKIKAQLLVIQNLNRAHYTKLVSMAVDAYGKLEKVKDDIKKTEKRLIKENNAHEDALEDLVDLEEDAADDIDKIWEKATKDKEKIEEELTDFLAEQADDRLEAEKDLRDSIAALDDSLEDKIRKRRQEGMTDREKERDDESAYRQKIGEANNLIAEGIKKNDKGIIERGKKKAEQAMDLAEGYSNINQSVSAMARTTNVLKKAEGGLKGVGDYEAEQGAIEKKRVSEEALATVQIKAAEDVTKKQQDLIDAREEMRESIADEMGVHRELYTTIEEAEAARHTLEMDNIKTEVLEHEKKLALYEKLLGKLDEVQKKSAEDPAATGEITTASGQTASYSASTDDGAADNVVKEFEAIGDASQETAESIVAAMAEAKAALVETGETANTTSGDVGGVGNGISTGMKQVQSDTKATIQTIKDELGSVKEIVASGEGWYGKITIEAPAQSDVKKTLSDAMPESVPVGVETELTFKREAVTEYKALMSELTEAKRTLSDTPVAKPEEYARVDELKGKYGELKQEFLAYIAESKKSDGGISTKEGKKIDDMRAKLKDYFGYVSQESAKLRANSVLTFTEEDGKQLDSIKDKFSTMFEGMDTSDPRQKLVDIVNTLNGVGDDGSRVFSDMTQVALNYAETVDGLSIELTMDNKKPIRIIAETEEAAKGLIKNIQSNPFEPFSNVEGATDKIINSLGAINGSLDLAAEKRELDINADKAIEATDKLKEPIVKEVTIDQEKLQDSADKAEEIVNDVEEKVVEEPVTMEVEADTEKATQDLEELPKVLPEEGVMLAVNTEGVDEAKVELQTLAGETFEVTGQLLLAASPAAPATEKIDEIKEKLNAIGDEVPEVTIQLSQEDFTEFVAQLEELGGGTDITVNVKVNGSDDMRSLEEWLGLIDQANPTVVDVVANVTGTEDVVTLKQLIDSLVNKTVEVIAKVTGIDKVRELKSAIDKLKDKTITITTKYKTEGSPPSEARAHGGEIQGFDAGGGVFRKLANPFITRGGGSKDDVPAMLMKGEFVHKVAAVKKYGKRFMDMVNSGSYPIEMAKKAVPHFAKGGPVQFDFDSSSVVQNFARGGSVLSGVIGSMKKRLYELFGSEVGRDVNLNVDSVNFQNTVANSSKDITSELGVESVNRLTDAFTSTVNGYAYGGSINTIDFDSATKGINIIYDDLISKANQGDSYEQAAILAKEQAALLAISEELKEKIATLTAEYDEDVVDTTEDHDESVADAKESYNESVDDRDESNTDTLSDTQETYDDSVEDENESYNDTVDDDTEDYTDTETDYDENSNDNLDDYEEEQADIDDEYKDKYYELWGDLIDARSSAREAAEDINTSGRNYGDTSTWRGESNTYPYEGYDVPDLSTYERAIEGYWVRQMANGIDHATAATQKETALEEAAQKWSTWLSSLSSLEDLGITNTSGVIAGTQDISSLALIISEADKQAELDEAQAAYDEAKTNYDDDWSDYTTDHAEDVTDRDEDHVEALADYLESYDGSNTDENESYAEDMADYLESYNDSVDSADESLADSLTSLLASYEDAVASASATAETDAESQKEETQTELTALQDKLASESSEDTLKALDTATDMKEEVGTARTFSIEELLKRLGKGLFGFNTGGSVPHTSTSIPGKDSIMAALTPGEFVMKEGVVSHFGAGFFDALNNFKIPGFNLGGVVGTVQNSVRQSALESVKHSLELTVNGTQHEELYGSQAGIDSILNDLALAKMRS